MWMQHLVAVQYAASPPPSLNPVICIIDIVLLGGVIGPALRFHMNPQYMDARVRLLSVAVTAESCYNTESKKWS